METPPSIRTSASSRTPRPVGSELPSREPVALDLLVLNYEYPPIGGGASPVTAAVARELARLGHRLDVVTMAWGDLPPFEDQGSVRIHRVKCLRSSPHICHFHELASWVRPALRKARELTSRRSYDLVHSHFFMPCGVVARKIGAKSGIPYVITAHGTDVRGYNPDRFRFLHRLFGATWQKVLDDARAITSPSRSLADLIRNNSSRPCDVEVIPNGIRADWMGAEVVHPETKRKRILLVSRLFERKGAQFLLEALRDFSTGWEVHIVGEGPHRPALERLARDVPDSVTFHGWLKNDSPALAELYRTSSIFVFPSIAENFPISLLEAMISANAIIATGLMACEEVLGDTARTMPPGDVDALRAHLRELVADESIRLDLGRRARRRALEKFSWEKIGRRYHDLFTSLSRRA